MTMACMATAWTLAPLQRRCTIHMSATGSRDCQASPRIIHRTWRTQRQRPQLGCTATIPVPGRMVHLVMYHRLLITSWALYPRYTNVIRMRFMSKLMPNWNILNFSLSTLYTSTWSPSVKSRRVAKSEWTSYVISLRSIDRSFASWSFIKRASERD